MLKSLPRLLTLVCVFAALPLAAARAELRVDVTRGNAQPLPIAVTDFRGDAIGAQISEVVNNNLRRSGLFNPINPNSFIERSLDINATPRFADWRAINSQALVNGQVSQAGGKLTVEFRLWDVLSESQMLGRRFSTSPQNWRQLAHMISDAIYSRLTGEKGYFNTRVVFVAESGPAQRRVKRLTIMDQDGANVRYLTDGNALVLTPRFSPNEQMIAYMSYEGGQPAVYIYNLSSGSRYRLGNFPGMTFSPRFSPDGNSVVMSLSRNGNTDIYRMDLGNKRLIRLTNDPNIETSPSYSPDGSKIVFESDRGGTQQLYVMNADGSGVRRLTFGKGRYASPVWSPRGDLIAFTRMYQGSFYIGVIRADGSGERMISTSYHVEGPTWAPNGRVLMYFKEASTGNGRYSKLYSIDITGANEQAVPLNTSASDPAWSPHLQ
jgi:TolB protein